MMVQHAPMHMAGFRQLTLDAAFPRCMFSRYLGSTGGGGGAAAAGGGEGSGPGAAPAHS